MKINCQKYQMVVEKEDTDPKFYGIQNAAGESNFLYKVKNYLNKKIEEDGGLLIKVEGEKDVVIPVKKFVKKRMAKDGHMMDDMQQYIRSEKPFIYNGTKTHICFYNDHWAINGLDEDFNDGKAIVKMEFLTGEWSEISID